jgi:hypothetical protein
MLGHFYDLDTHYGTSFFLYNRDNPFSVEETRNEGPPSSEYRSSPR